MQSKISFLKEIKGKLENDQRNLQSILFSKMEILENQRSQAKDEVYTELDQYNILKLAKHFVFENEDFGKSKKSGKRWSLYRITKEWAMSDGAKIIKIISAARWLSGWHWHWISHILNVLI